MVETKYFDTDDMKVSLNALNHQNKFSPSFGFPFPQKITYKNKIENNNSNYYQAESLNLITNGLERLER